MRLKGRAAIITGAASGIGLAIAKSFAAEGAMVLMADRDEAGAKREAAQLSGKGQRVIAIGGDVSRPETGEELAATCEREFGRIDILVNNAGIAVSYAFIDQPVDQWNKVMAVNVTGALVCGQAAAKRMLKQNYGRIINIASVSGLAAGIGRTAYGTSKAAIIGLTRQMALELGPHGVLANAVAPGPIDTPMTVAYHTPETRLAYAARIPQKRYGTPEEIAATVLFLASEEASYINGQVIAVDGGYLAAGIVADDVVKPKS